MRAFAQAERFVSELESRKLRAAYIFVGDEAFFRKRFRDAILEHLVPADLRDFSFFEFDLAETDLVEILDRARTPSLMAPFQVFFVRGVKYLFGRGSHEEKLAAIEDYCNNPNPDALLVFVADHISIPADVRRMEMQDKERYQRIRETMGHYCGIVELARVEEGEAVRWISDYCAARGVKIDADGARELGGKAVERRQDRVAAGIARHDAPVAQPLRVRHGDVVLADRVDHDRAHVQDPAARIGEYDDDDG